MAYEKGDVRTLGMSDECPVAIIASVDAQAVELSYLYNGCQVHDMIVDRFTNPVHIRDSETVMARVRIETC